MKKKLQQGFSFVELMIALLLGVILLLGVMQVLISSSVLGTTSNNLSVNQDTARTVLGLLGGEAQRAGYKGCGPGGAIENNRNNGWTVTAPIMPIFSGSTKFIGIRFTYGMDEGIAGNSQAVLRTGTKDLTDCLGKKLYYRSYSYVNCTGDNGKEGLCIRGYSKPDASTANGDLVANEFIEGVTLKKVVFNVKKENDKFKEFTLSADASEPPTYQEADFSTDATSGSIDISYSNLITFDIAVETNETRASSASVDSNNMIKRDYSASYPLKNVGSK